MGDRGGRRDISDGEVYISNGDGYVYLTDSGLIDDISYTLLDCVQKEEIPQMASISEVKVVNEGTADIIYKEMPDTVTVTPTCII